MYSPPAARIGDPVTHDLTLPSGVIAPPPEPPLGGAVTIEGPPAAFVGCIVVCSGATTAGMAHTPPGAGAPPVPIVLGSPTVRINGRPAARWVTSGDFAGCTCQLGDQKLASSRSVRIGGPQAPAEFPFQFDAQGNLWFGKAIGVAGDAAFMADVAAQLITIANVPVGRRLFHSLENSGKRVAIRQTAEQNGYCQAVDPTAAAASGTAIFDAQDRPIMLDEVTAQKGSGAGSDSVVSFNPSYQSKNRQSPQEPKPSDAVLFHELEHANHNAYGKADFTPVAEFDSNEEKNTISDGDTSENNYLLQRGYNWQRVDHHGNYEPAYE